MVGGWDSSKKKVLQGLRKDTVGPPGEATGPVTVSLPNRAEHKYCLKYITLSDKQKSCRLRCGLCGARTASPSSSPFAGPPGRRGESLSFISSISIRCSSKGSIAGVLPTRVPAHPCVWKESFILLLELLGDLSVFWWRDKIGIYETKVHVRWFVAWVKGSPPRRSSNLRTVPCIPTNRYCGDANG